MLARKQAVVGILFSCTVTRLNERYEVELVLCLHLKQSISLGAVSLYVYVPLIINTRSTISHYFSGIYDYKLQVCYISQKDYISQGKLTSTAEN